MEKHSTYSTKKNSAILSHPTGGGVIIDIGTGDGRFVYQSARENPDRFYIGVDAQVSALEKISEKIHRRPAKGGLPNVLFIQAAVESMPPELDGVADEVHVHFPWGSLLRAIATGDAAVLQNLRRVCAPGAWLEIVMALDHVRDQSEIARLGLEPLASDYVESILVPRYRTADFEVVEYGTLPPSQWPQLHSSWAQRLRDHTQRSLTLLIARAG